MCKVCSAAESNDDFRILQNWWHIEAVFPPNPSYNIRQVMDLYVPVCRDTTGNLHTSESMYLDFSKKFSGLKIYARNARNNEIAFIEVEDDNTCDSTSESNTIKFMIHFRTDEFPIITYDSQEYYHVKLELVYSLTPDTDEGVSKNRDGSSAAASYSKLGSCSPSMYVQNFGSNVLINSSISIDSNEPLQPEFYLTLPVGWVLESANRVSGSSAAKNSTAVVYSIKVKTSDGEDEIKVELEKPVVSIINGKREYTFIASEDGKKMCNDLKSSCHNGISTQITYAAKMAPFFKAFCRTLPRVLLALIILVIFSLFCGIFSGVISYYVALPVFVSCAILTIAYYYTYITLRHQGYYFPEKTKKSIASQMFVIVAIVIASLGVIAIIAFCNIDFSVDAVNLCLCGNDVSSCNNMISPSGK